MPSTRKYRQGWVLLIPALALTAAAHVGGLAVYEAVRPIPPPVLWVEVDRLDGATGGVLVHVRATNETVRCFDDQPCRIEIPDGTEVTLDALPGEKTTFDGWDGCVPTDDNDVLRCHFTVHDSTAVRVMFGQVPDEVEVAMLDVAEPPPDITLPTPPVPEPEKKKTLEEIEAEKLEENAIEVAIVPPIPPDQLPPPQPPQPPEEKKETQPPPNMTMVEVPDENEVKDAPEDATHLSDKNRDVEEETRATETNLEKEMKGEAIASEESDVQSEEIGGAEERIRQNEESEASTADPAKESIEAGDSSKARGVEVGEEGEEGEEGKGEAKDKGMFAMRGIEGRGDIADQGGDGKKKGKRGKKGVKTELEFEDYERIVGKEKAEKERAIARREKSMKKGRYKKKLEAIKSALENFTPDVRPGNQTALKTRASPFAVYIARMHRKVHELWGFGYLEDLDKKGADYPLNDFDLFTSIEVAINPDGTIYKMTVAKTSGILEFDVAALHTIEAAGPYGNTPEKIRSVDERVYLRWGFYRNWRQCGTFNVEPYILTDIPGGVVPLPEGMDTSDGSAVASDDEDLEGSEESPSKIARGTKTVTPEPKKGSGAGGDDQSGGHVKAKGVDDEATYAANMWVAGYATGTIDRMLKVSTWPFSSGGAVVANDKKALKALYEGLIVDAGGLKSWELLTADQYTKDMGVTIDVPARSLILLVAADVTFAVVLEPKGGKYVATTLIQ